MICELRLMIKLFKNIVEKITFSKSFLPKNFSKIFALKNLLLIILIIFMDKHCTLIGYIR